jgi:hypothetical protein
MPNTIKLISPPGYGAIAPLDKHKHAGLGLRPGQSHAWCRELNAVFLNAVEFGKAALDFPIAFARDSRSGEFMPMAVLGLQQHNLFVDASGQWRKHSYIPAYVRRYPFCIAEVPMPGGEAAQQMICVQEDQLAAANLPLFDARGEPTACWTPIMQLIEAIENARQQTRVLTRRLEALELLTPFDAIALAQSGERLRLKGMFRVDEEKLQQIPGKDLRTLMKKGELRAVYAHLLSLENFARLLDYSQTKEAGKP